MREQLHLMVDIETMCTSPHAAVVAIGARLFDLKGGVGKGFEVFIDPALAQQYGEVCIDTMNWWHKQPAYDLVFAGKVQPADALHRFIMFVEEHKPETIWANSPQFDCTILRHMSKQLQLKFPFHYRDERDFRTMAALGRDLGVSLDNCWTGLTAHSPLDDATAQAMAIHRIIQHVFSTPAAPAAQDPVLPRRGTLRLHAPSSSTEGGSAP